MSRLLVTDATGFVGRFLLAFLSRRNQTSIVAAVRHETDNLGAGINQIVVPDISPDTDWQEALHDVTCVIHLAGVVPVSVQTESRDLSYQTVNVEGTLNLARQAVAAGVRRFIFVSSIKVNGEFSERPFTQLDKPAPANPYALSKYRAEVALQNCLANKTTELVVIRPPVIYGPGVKGKFRQLLNIASKGTFLPLGSIHNRRSMVALENLADLIITCIDNPSAANEIFMVSDGEDLSTTELLQRLSRALGKPSNLMPFPAWVLTMGATILGKRNLARSLCSNLQADISHTCETLGWKPPVSMDEALMRTVTAFLSERAETALQERNKPVRQPGILRVFDMLLSLTGLVICFPVFLILLVLGYCDTGSPLFRQQRVGRNKNLFTLVKFRTMRVDTVSVATHMVDSASVTSLGRFLRKTKLDELPQLWNVLKGEMSLVGPRPGLPNQIELIVERERRGIFAVRPGITGLAQINHIDMSTPRLLAETDRRMMDSLFVGNYFKYIFMTVWGRGGGDAIRRS